MVIGKVRDLLELGPHRLEYPLVAVPQRRAPHSGLKVDVAFALRIVQVAPLRANDVRFDEFVSRAPQDVRHVHSLSLTIGAQS